MCKICDTHVGTHSIPSTNTLNYEPTSGEEILSNTGINIQEEPSNKRIKLAAPTANENEQGTLMIDPKKFEGFPFNDQNDFYQLRITPELVYFDRTKYISKLEDFTEKGLAIDQDVQAKRIIPGQYLVLSLDFSGIKRAREIDTAECQLANIINGAIGLFYKTYASYLGSKSSTQMREELIDPQSPIWSFATCVGEAKEKLRAVPEEDEHHPLAGVKGFFGNLYLLADEYDAFTNEFLNIDDRDDRDMLRENRHSLLRDFWACVKSRMGYQRLNKCFITGVTPLSLADRRCAIDFATNISTDPLPSGLCGLSKNEVLAALKLPGVCNSSHDIIRHFQIMEYNFGGYLFSPTTEGPYVFNTNFCLKYLQIVFAEKMPNGYF
ncbi:uncharacterized protein VTP21DRAFT_10240 [Calcarisporiella thermophila]|uniref:uncharacterized protein n=1 Tax=Calcarisporiella thermophila TaxID=911321 RepID=UPI003743C857